HWSWARLASRSPPIVGSATLTTVPSSRVRPEPSTAASRTPRPRGVPQRTEACSMASTVAARGPELLRPADLGAPPPLVAGDGLPVPRSDLVAAVPQGQVERHRGAGEHHVRGRRLGVVRTVPG